MANFDSPDLNLKPVMAAEYGNLAVATGKQSVNAAADAGDVIRFLRVPAGATLLDCIAALGAGPASVTLKLGWAYVNGETDSAGESSDDDFFFAATTYASSAALIRKTNAAKLTKKLEYDAFIQGVVGAADHSADVVMEVAVIYEYTGTM